MIYVKNENCAGKYKVLPSAATAKFVKLIAGITYNTDLCRRIE